MLLLAALALADDTLLLGEGPETVSWAELLAGGNVVGRTGGLIGQLRPGEQVPADTAIEAIDTLPDGVVRLHLKPGTDDFALARRLHAHPAFAWVHPDLRLRLVPTRVPDDPWFADEWHLDNTGQGGRTGGVDINAPAAWDFATGAGQLIAVLDSGVQLDHPDLVVIPGYDFVGRDDDPSPGTDSSAPHGTGVAGIAAARGNNGYGVAGVAWEADVYAVRLIGGATTTSDLYDAFSQAVDAGAGVLSNSWGFEGCGAVNNSSVFTQMFKYAERKGRGGLGSVVVFAAGNDGCDNSDDPMLSNENAVVVAALEWWDERASYSNWSDDVLIAAPTSLLTTDMSPGGYGSYGGDDAFADGFAGTSGATPVVSGVVALMLEANPRLTAQQVRDVLCQTATRNDLAGADWNEDGWSPYYGCGRIDAGAAVATVANVAPSAPVPRLVRDEVYEGRVVLAWEAAVDEDDDVLGYDVEWSVENAEDEGHTERMTGLALDLTGRLVVGDVVSWRVTAVDAWGAGSWSSDTRFAVVDVPARDTGEAPTPGAPATCEAGAAPPEAAALLGALAALASARRRRR
jgi:subtilisin family serine protease